MIKEDRLKEAAETGEVLRVIYYGGSQPGTARDIAPIQVKEGKVRAKCFMSNAVKLFVIEKLSIVDDDKSVEAQPWRPGANRLPHYESITDLLEKEKIPLNKLGWCVESSKDRLILYRKNSDKSRKVSPRVQLFYKGHEAMMFRISITIQGASYEEIEGPRPWGVSSEDLGTRYYASLDSAAARFIECAKLLAPRQYHR